MQQTPSLKAFFAFAKDTLAIVPVPKVAAFAIIALAASSVLAMLPTAHVELSQAYGNPDLRVKHLSLRVSDQQVLGEKTYATSLVFSNRQIKITATPAQFDQASQKWNYKISWYRQAGRDGSIHINGNVFVAKAVGNGEQYTGFSLTPGAKYYVTYFSKSNGKGVRVANRRPFTVLAAEQAAVSEDDEQEDTGESVAEVNEGKKDEISKKVTARFELVTKALPKAIVGVPYTAKIQFRYITTGDNYATNATFSGLPEGIGTGSASGSNTTFGILPGIDGPNGLASVTISGTPVKGGPYKIKLALTDQYNANAYEYFELYVSAQ